MSEISISGLSVEAAGHAGQWFPIAASIVDEGDSGVHSVIWFQRGNEVVCLRRAVDGKLVQTPIAQLP